MLFALNPSAWLHVGFKEGDSCWVSCDIVLGVTNHGSGANFTLLRDAGGFAHYNLTGGTQTPSWELVG